MAIAKRFLVFHGKVSRYASTHGNTCSLSSTQTVVPTIQDFGFLWQTTQICFQTWKYNFAVSLLYISYLKYKTNCIVVTPVCVEDKEHVLSYGHISPYMVYKCSLHMFYFNKKTTDIAIAHVLLELFFMQLFSIMSTLKYQQNLTAEQISTSPDMKNNTTACPLVGAGVEHRKAPQK
jgi:hypothetical protein